MKDGIYFSYKTTQRKNKINKYFLLKVFLIISILQNIKNSEINFIIQGSGNQRILGNYFKFTPSEVLVNGVKDNSCSKTCNLQGGENNITLRFNDEIISCFDMFNGAKNIKEIDLSNFDFSKVTDLTQMFNDCDNLEKIEFGNINTSSVIFINTMFQSCFKLKSIDFSNFDTSQVIDMSFMFSVCSSLEKIEFGNINTSSVEDMNCMFQGCYLLTSIDLSYFDTSKVTDMGSMFSRCNQLKYLNLSNFNTSKVETIKNMFNGCSSLIYLNLKSFKLNNSVNKANAFQYISSYVTYCIEDHATKDFLTEITSDCSNDCFKDNVIIDFNNKKCTGTCSKYICNNICYNECPEGTYSLYCYDNNCNNKVKECFNKTPEGYYLDEYNKKYKKCFEKCKYCYGEGNETNNNCIECKFNFTLLNYLNDTNCYENCEYYYYFDDNNNYYCTLNDTCPEQYNQLIADKNQCIKECKNDEIYKYEFDNRCYNNCPNNTYLLINNEQNICYNKTP